MEPFVLEFGNVTGKDWVDDVAALARIVRKVAREFGAAFVPLQKAFNDAAKRAPQEYWLVDGVHPRPAGHQLIANTWAKAAAKVGVHI